MGGLLFGTGGIPHGTHKPANILNGIKHIAELGLGCTELEFVYGVRMSEADAAQVAATAQKQKVRLTAHAPYYINLNAHENDKLVASQERLLQTVRVASLCGANDVVFHSAFYLKDDPAEVYTRLKKLLSGIMVEVRRQNKYLSLRPELMGKHSQFGSLEELLRARIASTPYGDHVLLYGDMPHAVTLRATLECDLLLRTTRYDGDSVAVREARYIGTPVIATDNGMRPEGVHLIPPSDAGRLRDAVCELLSGERTRRAPGGDGQENIRAVVQFYEELLRR